MSILTPILRHWHRFTGGEQFSVTVPVMDGPLKPDDAIDRAALVARLPGAANLVVRDGALLVSRGAQVLAVEPGGVSVLAEAEGPISALAVGPGGELAIGIAGKGVEILAPQGRRRIVTAGQAALGCVTALCFLPDGGLAIANGSATVAPDDWAHDLMGHGASGLVALALPGDTQAQVLVTGLRYPSGLCAIEGTDRLAVSEAWAHRIIDLSIPRRVVRGTLADHLPAYPARLTARPGGGYVLATYATRSQLIEFVLREKRYLRRMRQEVAPDYWIAPALRSGASFKEPLQAGGVIRLGIHKPWAPTRSYGLLIGLSADFRPVWSAHSRADGRRHGVTSAAATPRALFALSQGNGDLVRLRPDGTPDPETTP